MFPRYCLQEYKDINFFADGHGFVMEKEEALIAIEKLIRFYENPIFDIQKNNKNILDSYNQEQLDSKERSREDYQEELKKFEQMYDSSNCSLDPTALFDLYNDKKLFDGKVIDLRNINNSVVVTLYKNDSIVFSDVSDKEFDKFIAKKRQKIDFDFYSIVEVDESIALALATYLNLHFNNNFSVSKMNIRNGLYVTKNHLKKRYKREKRVTWTTIKKVITMYKVPQIPCVDNFVYVKKDFDLAMNDYLSKHLND